MSGENFLLALSQDLISASISKGAINGVAIDNPSGSWLLVEPIHLYVPPYVSGWQNPMRNAISVTVRWVDSPSGSVSNLILPTGQFVRVTLDTDTLAHSDGFPSGAGARVTIIPPTLTAFAPVGCVLFGTPDAPATVVAATLTQRLVIRRLSILPDLSAGLGAVDPQFLCTVQAVWDIFPSLTFSWYQSATPEDAYITETIEDGAVIIPPGEGLRIRGYAEGNFVQFDGLHAAILAQIQYYIETVI